MDVFAFIQRLLPEVADAGAKLSTFDTKLFTFGSKLLIFGTKLSTFGN